MFKSFSLLLLLSLIVVTGNISAQKQFENFLTGKVTDAVTGEALPGATVVVNEIPGKGAATNEDGEFRIKLPVGAYSLRISQVGYISIVKTDVIINAGRERMIEIKLQSTTVEMEGVVIKGDYFDKSLQANNLSTVVLSAEEVRRSPGSVQDFQRILQSMPGVAFSTDQNNELLVRGGSPNENLVILDDIEIHSVNHFPNEYNSAGPINMVNVDLIEDVRFSTGGFISKYGDKLSSIVIVNTREGRRNVGLAGNANVSFAGAGLILEGGIGDNKGAWLVSARKSYLDLVVDAIGMTDVPQYYDGQFKLSYDLSSRHKLSFSGIYGNDHIDILDNGEKTDIRLANRIDSVNIENVLAKQYQFAVGGSIKSLWSKNFFTTVTLFSTKYHYDFDVSNDFIRRQFDGTGKMLDKTKLSNSPVFRQLSDETEAALKFDLVYILSNTYEVNAGAAYRTGVFDSKVFVGADTARYDLNADGIYETGPVVLPAAVISNKIRMFDQNKIYFYLNNKFKFFDERALINAGLRYDRFSYSSAEEFSPRISFSYYLIPAITNINFAFGYYYQTHAYPVYGDRYNSKVNINLQNSRAIHYIAGFEHILDEGLKVTVEAYIKRYDRIPISEEFIHFNDRSFRSERMLNIGEQNISGIDFVLQQKLVRDYYGTLSISYMNSKMKDPRLGYEGKVYPSDFEYPWLFTVILGKRFTDLRKALDEMPPIIKYSSHLLPFSDDMEISFKWRYSSGNNYTPKEFTVAEQHREGGAVWGRGEWQPTGEINAQQYPAFHRLDVAFNSRFNFSGWNLIIFLSIQNLYARENIARRSHSSDGTFDYSHQMGFLPVLGMEAEF